MFFQLLLALTGSVAAVSSPDGKLKINFLFPETTYNVCYDGVTVLEDSPLGLRADFGDFSNALVPESVREFTLDEEYSLETIKRSTIRYKANGLAVLLKNEQGQKIEVEVRISNNDVAIRYNVPRDRDTGCIRVLDEATGFRFPEGTTTFLCPQSDAMIGWKRSKPSYEEEYKADSPMDTASQYGHGYTFPCLFHVGDSHWVLLNETGVDSRYCGSHLSDFRDGIYKIAFPLPEENNGNGTSEPAFSLPGSTPWRTITVGDNLKPIVETTAPWDNVRPLYETTHDYRYGKSTWSWIVWQDASMNYGDQQKFIDLAYEMNFSYILIDAGWDKEIGKERMKDLIDYAHSKNVDVFLWYSSSGYWNDIVQSPINVMDNSIARKAEMKWMESLGVKGIKVDFWGGDKQETMRLYEEVLSDADDHGLMVIFHGCTLPRGWERMYPNYVGSEAVLASENLIFTQHACDMEAFNACLHPFIRNTVGCMEFGGVMLNDRMSKNNDRGSVRRTTLDFELATAIIFQNPIQNFAVTPLNLQITPEYALDFLRSVPTTWDETEFLDGYPGKFVKLRRRHADKWYEASIDSDGNGSFIVY